MNPADLFDHDANPVLLRPGEVLFREGDEGDSMFVLPGGTADVTVGRTLVEHAATGALLGEMALIDQTTRTATITATTPARLAKIDKRRFHFLVQQTPNFATHVMKVLAARLRHMNQIQKDGASVA